MPASRSKSKSKSKSKAKAKAKPAASSKAKSKAKAKAAKSAKSASSRPPKPAPKPAPTRDLEATDPARGEVADAPRAEPGNPSEQAEALASLRAGKRAKSATARQEPAKPTKPTELGTVLAPGGVLGIFDIGLVGFLPREALEPVIVKLDVPPDRELPVIATPIAAGRWQGAWDHVAVAIGGGDIASSRKIGEVAVDLGHVACMDVAALDAWRHEDALDGLADIVFDGADAAAAARIIGAKRLRDGHGWTDMPLADAEKRYDDVLRKKSANDWRLAAELRPHSHHHRVLDGIGRSAYRATTLELAGGKLVVFATGWGQGVYPIFVDRDAQGGVVRVRIQLAPPA